MNIEDSEVGRDWNDGVDSIMQYSEKPQTLMPPKNMQSQANSSFSSNKKLKK